MWLNQSSVTLWELPVNSREPNYTWYPVHLNFLITGYKIPFFSLSSGVKSSPKCKFSCSCSCWCWGEWQNFAQISQVLAAQSCQIGKKQILLDMVKTLEWKAWDFYCTEWLKYAEIQIMSYHQDGLQLAQAVALMPDGYGNSVQSSLHCDREM